MQWSQLLSSARIGSHRNLAEGTRTPSEKPELSRSAFEQDYDRIIFSHPFRRLQDKTQVHPLPEHDFVHTRLTHSLEVSTVGRSLGKNAGEILLQRYPELSSKFTLFDFGAIVAAASLTHDLGNPPFGHAGEDAISDFFLHHTFGQGFQSRVTATQWEELVKFEGNAQGFRILNKSQYGLKLTLATLGAFTKYPCQAFFPRRDKSRKSQKKFGFFESEQELFNEAASSLGLIQREKNVWSRHPLAFLVEAADDICYSIIDLEDGCRLGLVGFDETVDLLAPILGAKLDRARLTQRTGLNEKLGTLRAMAIGELIEAATTVFLDHEKAMLDGEFDKALIDLCQFSQSIKIIGEVSVDKIYHARNVVEIEAAGHEVLPGLLHEFIQAAVHLSEGGKSRKYQNLGRLLPEEIRSELHLLARRSPGEGGHPYLLLRLCIDFISGMTDRHAISMYRKIKGISLS